MADSSTAEGVHPDLRVAVHRGSQLFEALLDCGQFPGGLSVDQAEQAVNRLIFSNVPFERLSPHRRLRRQGKRLKLEIGKQPDYFSGSSFSPSRALEFETAESFSYTLPI
jgi:hypothetical protein